MTLVIGEIEAYQLFYRIKKTYNNENLSSIFGYYFTEIFFNDVMCYCTFFNRACILGDHSNPSILIGNNGSRLHR